MNRVVVPAALAAIALGTLALPARNVVSADRPGALRVGLVFDVGGRGDKSFNDAAYAGLRNAARADGIGFELAEPAGSEDREGAMRAFASRGFDLVIGVGYIFTRDVTEVSREFPNVRFACVDWAGGSDTPANVEGLVFREEEGAFLVGAAAALTSRKKSVGFIGGMNVELIRKFEAGFHAGVREVCPSCMIHVAYAGTTPDAFRDPAKGKAIAAAQIGAGADVLFHAAGSTGNGVFEAARESGVLAIGVDRDQADEMPGVVVTSLVKRVDTAVADVIHAVVVGDFHGGLRDLGLREHGVDWVHEGPHAALLSKETIARVEELRGAIVDGKISVPKTP